MKKLQNEELYKAASKFVDKKSFSEFSCIHVYDDCIIATNSMFLFIAHFKPQMVVGLYDYVPGAMINNFDFDRMKEKDSLKRLANVKDYEGASEQDFSPDLMATIFQAAKTCKTKQVHVQMFGGNKPSKFTWETNSGIFCEVVCMPMKKEKR